MLQKLLATCLEPVIAAERRLRRRRWTAAVLVAGALGCAALALVAMATGWWSWPLVLGGLALLTVVSFVGHWRIGTGNPDLREIARRVEEGHPDLRSALLAAMDQKPGPDGELGFLQRRLLGEISEHALRHRWVRRVSAGRLAVAGWGQFAAMVAFAVSLWFLLGEAPGARPATEQGLAEEGDPPAGKLEARVTPGDVELEKGSRLVVEAAFAGGPAPASATLVHRHAGGETRLPMQAGLDDAVFSLLIPKVDTDGSYEIVYGGGQTRTFSIAVFEYPELSRADAVVTPPDYLGAGAERIADTRKITVMEGSQVAWESAVTQPVVAGELFGEDGEILPLVPDPADATRLSVSHLPAQSKRYRVHLVDAKDRANQRPPWLTVNVRENQPPKLKLTFPGRDFEVSALQELPLEAEVWDDVEVLRAGVAYEFRGQPTEIVLSAAPLAGETSHPLATRLDIEALGAKERDLVTYHFWAEDRDRDGQVRRTASDQFFAEVRLFEEILREGAAGQPGGMPGGESGELLKLQKDIVNALWRLVRDHEAGKAFESIGADVPVVSESQEIVVAQLEEAVAKTEDPEVLEFYRKAKESMGKTVAGLASVSEKQDGAGLSSASGHAKDAYAELVKARARETEISRSQSGSPGSSQEMEQRNLNLELQQKELKYEEQSVAETGTQTPEQKENLAVLNRLRDLARRQEAIAEKIKELENLMQGAKDEDRAEIERQLKRLEEEQRELLRELDDLSERMDSEENRSGMSAEREQLSKTRESVRETAEQLESGQLADAANSATRAGEQLERMKEEFREKTSRQFSKEMQALRDSVREMAEQQEEIGGQIEKMAATPEGEPDLERRGELAKTIGDQAERLSKALESMRALSEQAEPTEPILSNALYEAVREATMGEVVESLEEARDFAFYQRPDQAAAAEEAAARGIKALQERVEKAADSILGSESDALRLARSEIDKLIEETKAETERLAGGEKTEEGQAADATGASKGKEPTEGKGEGERGGEGETPAEGLAENGQGQGREQAGGSGALNNGGDGRNEGLPTGGPLFFDDASEERRPGPITGEDYGQWTDRLSNLEEILPREELRNAVARVRDDARAMRIDYRRDDLPPGAATINQRITEPLVELRQRIGEEIARLNRENPVAPIDRDPVPSEFRDLVRRYYEELGAGD
ncbi:MAG TPA: hypothetical protein PLA50_07885 [Bacteroidia bacterium]|nr:hypothetical protein [Bacteroidia bacterium]